MDESSFKKPAPSKMQPRKKSLPKLSSKNVKATINTTVLAALQNRYIKLIIIHCEKVRKFCEAVLLTCNIDKMFPKMLLTLCRPDFEVIGPNDEMTYEILVRKYEEANDILGLNPHTHFPKGANVEHLSGDAQKNALNTIRQRKFQHKKHNRIKNVIVMKLLIQ